MTVGKAMADRDRWREGVEPPMEAADLAAAARRLEGSVVAGRFVLERFVRLGGQGIVYRAYDRATGGACAVKIARLPYHRPACYGQAEIVRARERLREEARALAAVSGGLFPEVVALAEDVLSLHHPARGAIAFEPEPFLAMEWIAGEPLSGGAGRLGAEGLRDLARRVVAEIDRLRGLPGRWVYTDLCAEHVIAIPGTGRPVRLLDAGGLAAGEGAAARASIRRALLPPEVVERLGAGTPVEPEPAWTLHALAEVFAALSARLEGERRRAAAEAAVACVRRTREGAPLFL